MSNKPPTAATLAVDALENADGDPRIARESLTELILSNDDVMSALVREIVDVAVRDVVSNALHAKRAAQIKEARQQRIPDVTGLMAMAEAKKESVLEMWLTKSKKKLGDATADELVIEADMYATLAKQNAVKARWFQRIAAAIGDDIVRNKLSEKAIGQLHEEACTDEQH